MAMSNKKRERGAGFEIEGACDRGSITLSKRYALQNEEEGQGRRDNEKSGGKVFDVEFV
jgi:hypothetical protein